jgi:Xaa-Pro aminopeptidase
MRGLHGDGMLVTHPSNVTYLTGFSGEDSFLLLDPSGEFLLSDPRYEEQIGQECPGLAAAIRAPAQKLLDFAIGEIQKTGLHGLLIEGDTMSVSQFQQLQSGLKSITLGVSSGLVEQLRQYKDAFELESIRRAIQMAERAFAAVRNQLRGCQSEREIANDLDRNIRLLGGSGSAFRPIVGVGSRAALPHGVPSERRIEESPFVLIDWGANEGLYLSDLTRVLLTSSISAKFAKVYEAVLAAHQEAARMLRPGVGLQEVDGAARAIIDQAGFGRRFNHGLGHGFGLQIHESPRIGKNQTNTLQPNMVVTIEPGIYIPGWGGVRIEDDYWITPDGCERLTSLPREMEANVVHLL